MIQDKLEKITGVLSAELSRLLGNRLVRVYLGLSMSKSKTGSAPPGFISLSHPQDDLANVATETLFCVAMLFRCNLIRSISCNVSAVK